MSVVLGHITHPVVHKVAKVMKATEEGASLDAKEQGNGSEQHGGERRAEG